VKWISYESVGSGSSETDFFHCPNRDFQDFMITGIEKSWQSFNPVNRGSDSHNRTINHLFKMRIAEFCLYSEKSGTSSELMLDINLIL